MKNIPLVRVRYADSFARVLDSLGAPTERVLNEVGLSEEILSVPDGFMPVEQLWRFAALAARYTGIMDVGLASGLTPFGQHSQAGHNVMLCPNLYQAITLFCKQGNTEITNADFHVRQQQDMVWFCGGVIEGTEDEIQQVELYRLGIMVQVIRAALGMDWQPQQLQLQTKNEKSVQDTELIRNANVRFASKMLAIGLPHHAFILTLQREKDQSPEPRVDSRVIVFPESEISIEYAIKEVVRTHIRAHQGVIKHVAKSLDLSVRSLQRCLAENGLKFSQLIEQTRIETALVMLENTNATIVEIAMEAGYKEATNFSRAFKRNTGLTPQQYRFQYRSSSL